MVWGVSVGLSGAAPTAYAADVAPPGMNAAAMGTFRTLSDSGYFFGPFLLGAIASLAGTGSALVVTAVMLVVIGAGFALIAPEPTRPRVPSRQPGTRRPTDVTLQPVQEKRSPSSNTLSRSPMIIRTFPAPITRPVLFLRLENAGRVLVDRQNDVACAGAAASRSENAPHP